MKAPFTKLPYFYVCPAFVQELSLLPIDIRQAMAEKRLTAGQFLEFIRMSEINWLELCYILKLDVTAIPETLRAFFLEEEMRNTFLEVLAIYGKGYTASGDIALFNRWMKTERVYMGFLSPLSMLGTQAGRDLAHYWIENSIWTGAEEKDETTMAEFLGGKRGYA